MGAVAGRDFMRARGSSQTAAILSPGSSRSRAREAGAPCRCPRPMLAFSSPMRPTRLLVHLALLLLLPALARAEEARVVVLHTTDLHGALTAFDYAADRPAPRGLVRIASLVAAARRDTVPVLLLDAGDAIHGGPLVTAHRDGGRRAPEPMMTAMSRMGYDAMAVGNHEFSDGPEAREAARKAATFPWLSANVTNTGGAPPFTPSLVKSAGRVRVGIVGITTPAVPSLEDSSTWRGLSFGDPVAAASAEAKRLREAERCDVVILLAHTGLESDSAARSGATPDEDWGRRLARLVPDVDVIVLGHTHRSIGSTEVNKVLLTQAGSFGRALGRVDLTLARPTADARWAVTARRARVIPITDTTAVDSDLAAFAEPYHAATRAALAETVATAPRAVATPDGRFADGPLWELIHRVQLEATGADVSLAALNDPAQSIAAGPVTLRDVSRLYPYDNTLGVIELTGAELKATLEHSARALAPYGFERGARLDAPDVPGFQFDSAEGVEYTIDLTRPLGERVSDLTFQGQPLAADRRLRVAVNSYRLNGGGGYAAVRSARRLSRIDRPVAGLIADHLRKLKRLDGAYAPNWSLIPDYATRPERGLIDLLVRREALARDEARRVRPDARATRAEFAVALARAFGWRAKKPSGAFVALPEPVAAAYDALLERRVLSSAASEAKLSAAPLMLGAALDWCERAARAEKYALAPKRDDSFRRGLVTGLSGGGFASLDTLTRAQALGIVANLRYPTLRVLETTDFHGAILSTARERNTDRPVGGSAVLAAHIHKLRAENPEGTVLLDGGDCFQGTMISNLQFGRPVVEQMNALGYQAAAIGNHEFDWSADTLVNRVRAMKYAELGANMVERKSGQLPEWARSDTSFARRGLQIGVMGLCYRFTPSVTLAKHVEHLRFEDDSATAAKLVPRLRANSHVVLSVGHVSAESNDRREAVRGDLKRLAAGVPGVDLWLGGHSHNLVNDRVNGVPLMIAGSHGQYVAVCDLVVDPVARKVVESWPELKATYVDEVTPDSAMLARVQRWNAGVAPIASQKLGENLRRMGRNRGGEAVLGNFVCDAIRRAAGVDIAFQNSGGLRADLPEGAVTKGTIYEVMPFDNTVFTLDLTGAEIRLALEQGLRRGRVTQVSGIRYAFDLTRPEMDRVVTLADSSGAPLDPAKTYRLAVNDFMATGGDDYDVLSKGANRTNTGITVRELLEEYVVATTREGKALDYKPEKRIERLGGRVEERN